MPPTRPDALTVLRRGAALRCPACGEGRIFRKGIESAAACGVCNWRIERCPGHWVGGNEINVIVTFGAGVAAWGASLPFLGLGLPSVIVATVVTAVCGVVCYRPSRGLYYAIDYLIDPDASSNAGPPPPAPPDPPPGDRDDPSAPPASPASPSPSASSASPASPASRLGAVPAASPLSAPAAPKLAHGAPPP